MENDALTGLESTDVFRRRLAAEIARAERYGRPLVLILLGLDNLEADGQASTETVLGEVGRRITSVIRIESVASRLDGGQLAVLVPECDAEGGYLAAERIRVAVGDAPINAHSRVTLSAGVATLEPADREEDLIEAADAALYAAKRLGGDSSVLYTSGLESQRPHRRRQAEAGAA
jgi:diguanylate cyclase (GGDEF)-like protein